MKREKINYLILENLYIFLLLDDLNLKIIKVLGNELTIKNVKLEKRKHFIGIRPEHLKINNETKFKFSPEIDIIENLGNEKIVYMKKDNHQLSAKISSGTEIGNSFGFDLQNIFIFNENGKRIKS